MRFIHIGDAHIREQTWANIPEVRGDASKAVFKVVDYAISHKIDTLVLSGDVFHSSKPTSRDIEIFNSLVKPFDYVLYIEGNHERSDPPWLNTLNAYGNMRHLTPSGVTIGDTQFYGIDYTRSSDDTIQAVASVISDSMKDPKPVLVMHCGFKHMINFEGASQIDATQVAPFKGLVLVSHVHKRKTYKNIHSPGPLFPQNWEEVGDCFVDLIDTDHCDIEDIVKTIDVTVRNYHTIKLEDVKTFKDTPRELPTLVRVLTNDPKDVIPEIKGCIVVPVITGKTNDGSAAENAVDVMSIDEAIMAEYEDKDDGSLMVDLFHSESPEEYIDKFLINNNIDRRHL